MKLRNKILNRSKLLLLVSALILAFFWGVFIKVGITEIDKISVMLFGFLTVLLFLNIIPVFFLRTFSKKFDAYYETLLPEEKQQFENELAKVSPKQKIILTSNAIVKIDFIVISAVSYSSIVSVQRQGVAVFLYGENGFLEALRTKSIDAAEQLMQEIMNHNGNIARGY